MDPTLMSAPAEPASDDSPMAGGEICVPLAGLAQSGEKGEAVNPAPGDKGSAMADYTVSRVEGDKAYITLDAMGGEPIAQDNSMEPSVDDEASAIRAQLGGQQ